jgi:DNA (cytosine-5)-methyltransferase 1
MTPAEIKAARLRLGMSQAQIAEALELGKGGGRTVRGWEKGEFVPTRRSVSAIKRLLAEREAAPGATGEGP